MNNGSVCLSTILTTEHRVCKYILNHLNESCMFGYSMSKYNEDLYIVSTRMNRNGDKGKSMCDGNVHHERSNIFPLTLIFLCVRLKA